MAGTSVFIDFKRRPDASADAPTKLHELLVETIDLWMDVNLGESASRLRRGYYEDARSYATKHEAWGPSASSQQLEYFFTDFSGLDSLGSRVLSHWYRTALSLIQERIKPLVDELALEIRVVDDVPPDRLCTRRVEFPLVELGDFDTEIYRLEWPDDREPSEDEHILFSSERVERRSLASLAPKERAEVEERAFLRTCGCRACKRHRDWFWEGRDPWGRQYDYGWDEGVTLFEKGDFRGSRTSFLKGLLRGAPFAQEGFGAWIGRTFGREGEREEALRWLRYAVDDGYAKLEGLRERADFATVRGPELDALTASGPKKRHVLNKGEKARIRDAWELLAEPARLDLARKVNARLGSVGPYPDPRPQELTELLDTLEERCARPPPADLVAMCAQIGSGSIPSKRPTPLPVTSATIEDAAKRCDAILARAFERLPDTGQWDHRITTLPFPDQWPLTPKTKLYTYGLAYKDGEDTPELPIMSEPFATVVHGLDHRCLDVVKLTDVLRELGVEPMAILAKKEIDCVDALTSLADLFASGLSRPLDEAALSAVFAHYELSARSLAGVYFWISKRHVELFAWFYALQQSRKEEDDAVDPELEALARELEALEARVDNKKS